MPEPTIARRQRSLLLCFLLAHCTSDDAARAAKRADGPLGSPPDAGRRDAEGWTDARFRDSGSDGGRADAAMVGDGGVRDAMARSDGQSRVDGRSADGPLAMDAGDPCSKGPRAVFGPAIPIARVGANSIGNALSPALAAGACGNVAIAWQQFLANGVAMYGTPAMGPLEQSGVAAAMGAEGRDVNIALGSGGVLHAVWRNGLTGASRVFYGERDPSGNWSSAEEVSGAAGGGRPVLALGPSGDLHVAWLEIVRDAGGNLSAYGVHYRTKKGGAWSPSEDTSGKILALNAGMVDIAVSRSGEVALAYPEGEEALTDVVVIERTGGTWGGKSRISDPSESADDLSIAFAPDGTLHASWIETLPTGDGYRAVHKARPPGGDFPSSYDTLEALRGGFMFDTDLAVDEQGHAHVVWQSGGPKVSYASSPFSAPIVAIVVNAGVMRPHPKMAVDGRGVVHVAFNAVSSYAGATGTDTAVFYVTNLAP